MHQRRHNALSTVLGSAAALGLLVTAGCGGAGSSAAPRPPVAAPSSAPAGTARATISIIVSSPPRTAASARRPRYVSPGTTFVQIEINHATTQSFTMASGTPCTPPPGATSCVQFAFDAPVGDDTFVVTAFQNATTVLSQGTTQATIVKGVANAISVTLSARVASLTLSLAKPAPPQGAATRGLVLPVPLDAAGFSPLGSSGALPNIVITDSDGSGTTALFIGTDTTCATAAGPSSATVTATQSGSGYVPVCMSYAGGALPSGATISAAIAGVPAATAAFKPLPASGTVSPGGWGTLFRFDASLTVLTSIDPGALVGQVVGLDVDQADDVYAFNGPVTPQATYQIAVFSDTQSGTATPISDTRFRLPSDTIPPVSDGVAGPALDGNGNAYVLGQRPNNACEIYRIPLVGGAVAPIPAYDCGAFINPVRSQLRGFHSDAQHRIYVGFNNHAFLGQPGPSAIYRLSANPDGTLALDASTFSGAGFGLVEFSFTPAGAIDAVVEFGRIVVVAPSSFTTGSWAVTDNYDAAGIFSFMAPIVTDHAGNIFVAGQSGSGFTFAVIPAGTHALGATSTTLRPGSLGAAR